jgi:DNA-binding CsgD family transcriptional regulator
METLAIGDIQQLNQSIQQLYALHDPDTFAINVLSIIDRLVPSNFPCFQATHHQTRQLTSTIFLGQDPGFFTPKLAAVMEQYYAEHPIVQHMPQTLQGAYKISDFLNLEQFHRLDGLYQQFLRPFGIEEMMTLFLPPTNHRLNSSVAVNEMLIGFCWQRPQRSFTERDRLILNLLRPHLCQVYANAEQHQQLQQNCNQLQQSLNHLGAVVLNRDGQILSIAPQAIIWLETYVGKSTCTAQLPDLLWSWVKDQIANVTNPLNLTRTCLPLGIQQAGRELTIRLIIEPTGAQYLLLLREQTLASLNSLELLGLSQRETEVLSLIIRGHDNKTIATKMNVQTSTIRKHLENIYRKLEVKSCTEAIATALDKLGYLSSLPSIKSM